MDWIIATGANLYHDTHFGLGLAMHRGNVQTSDVVLREEGVVRIYDIFFDYHVLLSTDAFFRQIMRAPEFQRPMSSAEFHYLCGKYVKARETRARDRAAVAALGGVHVRRADLHVVAGRFVDRDERRGARARGIEARARSEPGRERDGGDRPRREARRREERDRDRGRRESRRTSRCRRSRRSRRCSASTSAATTSSCRSRTRGRTPAG